MRLGTAVVLAAVLGAVLSVVAATAKLSFRLEERTVARLYYASYACTGFAAVLWIMRGLFGGGISSR